MRAKKIGTLSSIFNLKSQIARFILQGLFEKKDWAVGSTNTNTEDLQKMFKWKVHESRSTIMIQKLEGNRMKVDLGVFIKTTPTENAKISGGISTKEQFIINFDTFDIFDGEY